MKLKAIFVPTAMFVLFCCNLNQVQAQTDGGATARKTTTVAFCDAKLPAVQKELQADANETCTTQTTCVECMDRASKIVLAATIVVQPTNPGCKPVTNIDIDADFDPKADAGSGTDAKSRGADTGTSAKPTKRFAPQLIQSPCFRNGTNLEVYVPGFDSDSREFAYLWEIDGKKAGHLPSVQCACGKEAKVRVTYLPANQTVLLVMKLNSTCGDSGTDSDK